MATLKALHLKDAQKFLDECTRNNETVSLTALKRDGSIIRFDGWRVTGSWWRGGTHRLLNPASGEIRQVRDILIFSINDHPVYI